MQKRKNHETYFRSAACGGNAAEPGSCSPRPCGRDADHPTEDGSFTTANGAPAPYSEDCPFTDVKPESYYYKAVLWAAENGIAAGTTPASFGPNQGCTRAQAVTFLYKASMLE